MNLRSGKTTNDNQPMPKRKYNREMVNSTSDQGGQNPPQGSGTVVANSLTSMSRSQAIPTSTGPVATNTSMPTTTGTIPTVTSTTTLPFVSTREMPQNAQ